MHAPSDGIYHPGDPIILSWLVFNYGDETSDDYTLEFYAGDYSVGSTSCRGLRPNSTGSSFETFSLPSDIPFGSHTLRMELSCSNDDTPNNNETTGSEITVAEQGPPDLEFIDIYVTRTPDDNIFYGGDSVVLGCEIKNIGHSTSDSYTVNFYMDDYSLGSESCSGIEGHGWEWLSSTVSLPYDLAEGLYYINAEISCSNDSNTGNNSASTHISVGAKAYTDISVESVDAADGIYLPGDSILVDIVIEGAGGQLNVNCEIDVYASVNPEITTDDYKIYSYSGVSIIPEELSYLEATCQFPSDIPGGEYFIGIIVTYSIESGPRSIQTCDYSTVYIGGPSDLRVQSVDAADGRYASGDQIEVYSLIKNIGEWPSSGYTVNYYASTGTNITADDYNIGHTQRSGLAPGEQHSYETTCNFPRDIPEGTYYIGAIALCSNDDNPGNNQAHDSTKVRIATPVVPPGSLSGQMNYQDRDGGQHPIRYAMIEVYGADNNNDPLDDRVIGQTHTDHNGNYNVTVLTDGAGGRELYVKVFTESVGGAYPETTSEICSVRDDVFNEVYYMQSENYPVPKEALLTVDMCAPNDVGEFMVYDSLVEGFVKAKKFFEIELDEVMAYWPCEEEMSYFDPCNMKICIAQEDRGDRDVIMHEYGHYIAQIYLFGQGEVGDSSIHFWNADLRYHPDVNRTPEEARNLAFREAWASLFSIATQYGDTGYPNAGDTKYQDVDEGSDEDLEVDLERDSGDQYSPGEFYENMNCCALWDIFDDESASDIYLDLISDLSLAKIWTTILDYRPDDIIDFWDGWFGNYDYERQMKYIFRAHNMPFTKPEEPVPPAPNNPPVADAGQDQTVEQTYSGGATVYLDGSGSYDPDGDKLTYEWYGYDWRGIGVRCTPTIPPGTSTVTLSVHDGHEYDEDTVEITVIPTDPETWIVE